MPQASSKEMTVATGGAGMGAAGGVRGEAETTGFYKPHGMVSNYKHE